MRARLQAPAPALRVGVLASDGDCVYLHRPGMPPLAIDAATHEALFSTAQCMVIAESFNLGQLWIHPTMQGDYHHNETPPAGWQYRNRERGWVSATHTGVWGVRQLYLTWQLKSAPEWQHAAPDELCAALRVFADALGTPFAWSPGAVGTRTLQTSCPRLATGAVPPPALVAEQETDFDWCRQLAPDEATSGYIVGYDQNAAYLAAAAGLDVGIGELVHMRSGPRLHLIPLSDRYKVGYFRVSGMREQAETWAPDVLAPQGQELGERWVTNVDLWAALDRGAQLHEAYVWDGVEAARDHKHGRLLRPWYDLLSVARAQLTLACDDRVPGAGVALAVFKRCYAQAIGWLAHPMEYGDDALARPDVRHLIMAQTRANIVRAIRKLPASARPFGVHWDALYFWVDGTPARDETAAGLNIGRGIGQYKQVGAVAVAHLAEAIAAMRSDDDVERRHGLALVRAAMGGARD